MGTFSEALSKVREVDPDRTIEAFYELFDSIERMDVANVCAAKRTIDLFTSAIDMSDEQKGVIESMNTTLIDRARGHIATSPNAQNYISIRLAFGRKSFRKRVLRPLSR